MFEIRRKLGEIFIKNSLSLRFMLSIAAVVTVLMTINLLWNIHQYSLQAEEEMREKAAVVARQLIATRSVIALRQDNINSDSQGHYEFKHLNPAAVGKEVGDFFNQSSGYKIKQTRFSVRAPENTPDSFEIEKMKVLAANSDLPAVWMPLVLHAAVKEQNGYPEELRQSKIKPSCCSILQA